MAMGLERYFGKAHLAAWPRVLRGSPDRRSTISGPWDPLPNEAESPLLLERGTVDISLLRATGPAEVVVTVLSDRASTSEQDITAHTGGKVRHSPLERTRGADGVALAALMGMATRVAQRQSRYLPPAIERVSQGHRQRLQWARLVRGGDGAQPAGVDVRLARLLLVEVSGHHADGAVREGLAGVAHQCGRSGVDGDRPQRAPR
jgi:hypothetical protein